MTVLKVNILIWC